MSQFLDVLMLETKPSFPKRESACIGNSSPTPVPRPAPVPKPTLVLMSNIPHIDGMPLFMCPYIEKMWMF